MESQFEEFEDRSLHLRRRKLLPWWMRFFSWLFMIMGGIAVLSIISLLSDEFPELTLYGFNGKSGLIEFVVVFPIFILNGLTGFYLYYEKDEAMMLAKLCGVAGVVACIASTVLSSINGNFTFQFEIILLALFLHRISLIQDEWKYRRLAV